MKNEDLKISCLLQLDNDNQYNFYNFYPHLKPDPHRTNILLSIEKTRLIIDRRIKDLGHYFYAPHFDDPFDIPINLPREHWEPARNYDLNSNVLLDDPQQLPKIQKEKTVKVRLKDFFQSKDIYQNIINVLLEEHLLNTTVDGKWKLSSNAIGSGITSLSEEKAMSAFGFILYDRNYFKGGVKRVEIARGLNEFFSTELKYKTYNRSHNEFLNLKEGPEIRSSKCYEYLGIFHMIKPQHSEFINSKPRYQ